MVNTSATNSADTTVESTKYITFKLANYSFALPSKEILKIVETPSPSQGGMVSMGLVQLAQYSIQIVDLPKLLALNTSEQRLLTSPESLPENSPESLPENPPFLVVFQNAIGELWGIAVHEPPDLMDIPSYALKAVPPEKRLTKTLRWISHMVTYSLGSDRHILLLLDWQLLLDPAQSNPLAQDSPDNDA
ncbi:MAG: chemotaxis protein CheW [Phormidesmis sp.]